MHCTHDDEAGITLVEIMVSLVIIGVVLTAFFTVLTGGLQSLSESRTRQTTSQLSTAIIEDLRRLAPSEIAMYDDPTGVFPGEFDPTTVSCAGTPGEFDPDGPGPLGCEVIVTNPLGAIRDEAPFQETVDAVDVVTIATEAVGAGVPDDTVRVTVVMTYDLPAGTEVVRRSGLFSEVSRG